MDYDIEKLLKQITELEAELKTVKKYGLVWDKENTREQVAIDCEKKIPILSNVLSKKIANNGQNNILIEGDNYHALTSLNYVLKNSIDVIYIDPPYNTGNDDFTYNDNYVNADDGYHHSKWLSFMKKRLALSRELLKETGFILISIDDNEQANLKLLCDNVFGETNFVANLIWKSKSGGANDSNLIATDHEYILVYAKNIDYASTNTVGYGDDLLTLYTGRDEYYEERGPYRPMLLQQKGLRFSKSLTYEIVAPDGSVLVPEAGGAIWRWNREKFDKGVKDGFVEFRKVNGKYKVYTKQYLYVDYDGNKIERGQLLRSVIDDVDGRLGTRELQKIFDYKAFTNPKPTNLIKKILKVVTNKDSLILDFFAGSGTTGQSVLDLNSEDKGTRRFILCTNNENGICENVTYERLKTVITGKRKDGSKYSDGIKSNLYYFKTDFINDEPNTEQAKYNLVEKVDALLCVAENIFDEKERNEYSSHFINGNRHLFIYNDYYNAQKFNEFRERVLSERGEKIVYIYSSDNSVDETLIEGNDIVLKPIPSKIYEIYKEIVEDIKRDI